MKLLLLVASLILSVIPLSAAESSAPAELAQLKQAYLESLRSLQDKLAEARDAAGAGMVAQEVERISNLPEINAPVEPPCGYWAWHHNAVVKVINPDGTVGRNRKEGLWRWIKKDERTLQIDWAEGWVDKLTLSQDGKTMNVVNNAGVEYTVRLLPRGNFHPSPEAP